MAAPQRTNILALTVPATTGTYTDTFVGQPGPASLSAHLLGNTCLLGITTILLAGFPSGVTIELWYLNPTPQSDPTNIANYSYGQSLLTAAGGVTVPLASYPGVLIRAKSGGTGGTATVWYTAD